MKFLKAASCQRMFANKKKIKVWDGWNEIEGYEFLTAMYTKNVRYVFYLYSCLFTFQE